MEHHIPDIHCEIDLIFDGVIKTDDIINLLRNINIKVVDVIYPEYDKCTVLALDGKVEHMKSWYLSEALDLLFSAVKDKLVQIRKIVETFNGNVVIDVSFIHFDSYPALEFSCEHINYISQLNASVDIDPY